MYLSHPCSLASVHQSASVRVGRFHGSSVVKEYFLPLNTALFWDATNTIRYIRHKRTHKSQLQQPACKAVIKCAVLPFFIYHMFPLPIFISKFKRTATSFEKKNEKKFSSGLQLSLSSSSPRRHPLSVLEIMDHTSGSSRSASPVSRVPFACFRQTSPQSRSESQIMPV